MLSPLFYYVQAIVLVRTEGREIVCFDRLKNG